MIKVESKAERGVTQMHLSGSTIDIAIETGNIVRTIYLQIKEYDEQAAKVYKDAVVKGMDIAFLTDEEIEEVFEKIESGGEKDHEEAKEDFDELIKALEDLKENLKKIAEDCDGEA